MKDAQLRTRLGGARLLVVLALLAGGLGLAAAGGSAAPGGADDVFLVEIPAFAMTPYLESLKRRGYGGDDVAYDVFIAPPEFFEATHRADEIMASGAWMNVVFVLVEYHYHDGKHQTFTTDVLIDGFRYSRPSANTQLSDDGHNRITALPFPDLPVSMLDEPHTFEMILPAKLDGTHEVLVWETPLEPPPASTTP